MSEGPEGTESGSEFRQKFEGLQSENKDMKAIVAKSLGVEASDLEGFQPSQFEARATEIREQRETERRALVEAELKQRGWSDDQVGQFFEGEASTSTTTNAPTPGSTAGSVGQISGTPPPAAKPDPSQMTADQMLAAGIAQRKKAGL